MTVFLFSAWLNFVKGRNTLDSDTLTVTQPVKANNPAVIKKSRMNLKNPAMVLNKIGAENLQLAC